MVFGTLALTIANLLKIALQIVILPVLARLLGPAAYGLVAMSMPLVLLANMISDAGLGNALVRKSNSSPELESTIFWFSLAMSLGMSVLVSVVAWPFARAMSQPELLPIVITLTVILPLGGSLSVANARISRAGNFGLFAVSDVVSTIVSSAAAIGAALAGAGAWSLVIQQCLLWTIKAAWLIPVSGFRPLFICRPALMVPYLSFGLHSVGSNLADFANKNFPTMVIGGLIGVVAAGHYAMAYQIVRMPELIISGPLYLSIFVSVAKWDNDRGEALTVAIKGLRGIVTILAPLFCGLALIADLAVEVVLGPAWAATGPILALLAPAGFFLCVYSFMGAVLMGLGRSEYQFRLILLSGVCLALGVILGGSYGGEGVACGFSFGAALAVPFYLYAFSRQLGIPVAQIVRETSAPLVATLAMAVGVLALERALPDWPPAVGLAALVLAGAISFGVVLAVISGRRVWADLQWLFAPHRAAEPELP
ncbi:MAG TPA: lipopolysaccharide biosynthesis protein [Xanthobacteraceae bacterium]